VHGAPRHLRISRLFVAYSIINTLFARSIRANLFQALIQLATRLSKAELQVASPVASQPCQLVQHELI
jgi:hypothetical protein